MQTIASKYKKLKKPVYAIFVDFKKAFDSVCRQALFYKMAKLGITGKFYGVLKDMYSNSYAYVKLAGHLSKKFKISKGTEQGHPLSPDLFKIFLHDLSYLLEDSDCPLLLRTSVSHLLWADDLIMLSLSPKTSQKQLDILNKYCAEWGIEVNEIKTEIIIFNKNHTKNISTKLSFNLGDRPLKIVETYCYLGVVLHSTGELRTAQQTLKTKAMRAFFGLKRTVIRSKLSFKSLCMLFDSLIKPIALYGAPVWTPTSAINRSIVKHVTSAPPNIRSFISKINRTTSEKVHLSFLKWALGVHKKASNVGTWGESGRYPLIYQSIRLTLKYYKRLLTVPQNTFIYAALKEQQSMKLPWYRNIEPLLKIDEIFNLDHVTAHNIIKAKVPKHGPNPLASQSDSNIITTSSASKSKPLSSKKFRVHKILDNLKKHFVDCWNLEKSNSSKLSFYNKVKCKFAREVYLDVIKGFSRRYSTTKTRISSHNLEIERGRYNNTPRENRICNWCNVSMGTEIVEDEGHVLHCCDLYADLRTKLITNLNKSPPIQTDNPADTQFQLKVDNQTLKSNLMSILSPFDDVEFKTSSTNMFNFHHKAITDSITTENTEQRSASLHRRSYIINCIGTFIFRALEKREKYLKDVQEHVASLNTIVINFRKN